MRLQTASYCIPHLCDTWGACRCGGILLQPCLVMMHRIECSFASAEGVSSNQRWHIAGAKSWSARRTWCNERKWSKMHNSNDRARLTNPSKVTTKTSLEFPHRAMNSKVNKKIICKPIPNRTLVMEVSPSVHQWSLLLLRWTGALHQIFSWCKHWHLMPCWWQVTNET